ncbi:serine-rich adhesin for platelets isoform X3 [Drosophila guanche]|uniref:Uncharacterized protein n=1 Tax=Drosophila guanche TaxID=7266 RepID=A0A3B0J8F1_DROGU|nr:serine-rich adhesin for platelets isoform X3 [Drosophila guanche]SPP78145.1 Hypothetical predicted protein [Drosophila guanche]
MTFYWWSHWFWITCLSVQLLSSHVHTYPRSQQEATLPVVRQTTKLYQTTVSQTWSTATQSNIMDLTNKPTTTAAAAVTPVYAAEDENESENEDQDEEEEEQHEDLLLNDGEAEQEEEQQEAGTDAVEVEQTVAQYEFKRSADFTSEQLNNFTNFSSSTSTNASSGTNNSSSTLKPALNSSSSSPATTTTTAASTSSTLDTSSAGTTAATTATEASTTGVVMAVAAAAAAAATVTVTTPLTSSATPSTPKINTEWLSDELLEHGEKAPFTLENANKEEELRRAESEHRSRKSKVLSAEYKHINRYINFSSDTKSLLTRSASAAPSVADGYDGANDEGNISSEALAIQRTYFLDAGAISAICFTVFGICCTVGTIGIVLYRRRFLNKPQALSEPDSSVYIDDSTMRVSDNSDEMYSLDNDSFLNSLEAMTIQNYWTDTVKHTKL